MKVAKSIGLFFLYPLCMFLIGGFTFWFLESFFYPGKQPESQQVVTEDKQIITSDTQYVIIETDLYNGSSVETTWNIPEQYIGMDRDKFIEAMEIYEQNPPLEEQNKGFVSVEVKSFSKEKVVIRKNYLFSEKTQHFYLTVKDNYVVVMQEDLKLVYMDTNILLNTLPERLQMEIMLNKYIESERELYDFLETYSS